MTRHLISKRGTQTRPYPIISGEIFRSAAKFQRNVQIWKRGSI
jgi:hypothetical protein